MVEQGNFNPRVVGSNPTNLSKEGYKGLDYVEESEKENIGRILDRKKRRTMERTSRSCFGNHRRCGYGKKKSKEREK